MAEQSKYNWKEAAQQEGGEYAEKLPDGTHRVEITRVVYGRKDGTLFVSKSNDPQIMLIFADELGREASQMVTLSYKAGFVLAKILEAAGAELDKMTDHDVTPRSFADPEFANPNLIGRQLQIEVIWGSKNGKEFSDIIPVGMAGSADELPQVSKPDDDIPL